ncbi:2,3-diaminopropionate biosynthesis protein SbnB [Rhizobium sp. NPDC090279]|uniref:2,3-diaminopropionate biosynthesis protein SbnB n=1 Tax=Rhizobium sp. NPDC090279 TaxID=3364499 RepID=UPI00383AD341
MLILNRAEVQGIVDAHRRDIQQIIADTYISHSKGETSVPHSVFLRFPDMPKNRIIGLPAYSGGARPVAGIKWISSFPDNIANGHERASAAIILNSVEDGRPVALIEGSLISAHRTAASAAVAASVLNIQTKQSIGIIGCGVINWEILRYLSLTYSIIFVKLFDIDKDRAISFATRSQEINPDLRVEIAENRADVVRDCQVVSIATTQSTPDFDPGDLERDKLLLHVSLRDIVPSAIVRHINVVDDVDHVLRERTSVDLASQSAGNSNFIHASLGGLLSGRESLPNTRHSGIIFSPFGLGILDLQVAHYVSRIAKQRGLGTIIDGFLN